MEKKERIERYRKEIIEMVNRMNSPNRLELVYIFVVKLVSQEKPWEKS